MGDQARRALGHGAPASPRPEAPAGQGWMARWLDGSMALWLEGRVRDYLLGIVNGSLF